MKIQRVTSPSDSLFSDIKKFYKSVGYAHPLNLEEKYIIAIDKSEAIQAAVRLVCEENLWLLRGMQVTPNWQKKGIGTKLLNEFHKFAIELNLSSIYCIPYGHLEKFYSSIGFAKIAVETAPKFLQERMKNYLFKHTDVILMQLDL